MTNFFKFYKSASNPTGMSGTVGGAISTSDLLPRIDTLFAPMLSSASIDVVQYRKLYIQQQANVTMTGVTLQLVYLDYPEHITFNTTTVADDFVTSPSIQPTGVSFTGSYLVDITLTGTTSSGAIIPVWLKQTIPAGSGDDNFVAFQLRVLGTII